MTNRPHPLVKTLTKSAPSRAALTPAIKASLHLTELQVYGNGWILDGEIRQHSPATRAARRMVLDNLLWFLRQEGLECCGTAELRAFLSYLTRSHTEEGGMWHKRADPPGRWGNPQQTSRVKPSTVATYHSRLRAFFAWAVREGALMVSPVAVIQPPVSRADQIQPFTPDQLEAVLAASRRTHQPRRDEAIITLLLDTGIRASELCGLRHRDLDLNERRITVVGKGDKRRTVYFGQQATKALWTHLQGKEVEADAPLFPSERGGEKGEHLSRFGLRDLIERLRALSGVQGVRCSAHTFRHSFAVSFLRAGGQLKALMEILGHTDAQMTGRYIKLAEADLANQRRFSPADQLRALAPGGRTRTWSKKESEAKKENRQKQAVGTAAEVKLLPVHSHKSQIHKITQSKITETQVREIKARLASPAGMGKAALRTLIAADFGISAAAVKEIDLGYSWRHIE